MVLLMGFVGYLIIAGVVVVLGAVIYYFIPIRHVVCSKKTISLKLNSSTTMQVDLIDKRGFSKKSVPMAGSITIIDNHKNSFAATTPKHDVKTQIQTSGISVKIIGVAVGTGKLTIFGGSSKGKHDSFVMTYSITSNG